ncbi:MAG: glycosyltransferase family 4 protein [Candidatus Binatia bacterium]|nr:glycosyltransferase family 4 protein [Candidatus Binatia bacterium]
MRIKIVVQRYGADLLGGAERHAALMAGILAKHHEVEVLTTTAGDYHTWSAVYPAGESTIDGVRVQRFPVTQGRTRGWSAVSGLLHEGFDPSDFARLEADTRKAFEERVRAWPDALQEEFIRGQGPVAPELLETLRRGEFDRVLFVTYLYPTTYDGLLAVDPEKARVVPTLHDEPPAYLPVLGRRLARATLLCSTKAEIRLVSRLYPQHTPTARLLGYGVAIPPDPAATPDASPFLLYAGRIDTQKGIGELLGWYEALRRVEPDPPRLVLIGEPSMSLPDLPGLELRGFVSEVEKLDLMTRALAFVHPSPFESLGIVLLESMAVRTSLLVNARSEVMVDHCRDGEAGLWVRDGAEFAAAVRMLLTSADLRERLGAGGRAYVEREYSLGSYERRLLTEFPT